MANRRGGRARRRRGADAGGQPADAGRAASGRGLTGNAAAIAAALLLVAFGSAAAPDALGPLPPCGAAPEPSYSAVDAPPRIAAWNSADLGGVWRPPACTGLAGDGFMELVALAGRFRAGDGDALLARIGAVSQLEGLRYWSTREQRWETLITQAAALVGPDGRQQRPDFTAAELRSGRAFYFEQTENRIADPVTYRMQLTAATSDRLVLSIENHAGVSRFLIRLLAPGELHSIYFLDRGADGAWSFYSLLRVGSGRSMFGWLVRQASYINRAAALYQHIAGLPGEMPPAMR